MNAIRAVSGCRVRTRGIEAALCDLIAQGSCCIVQPHGQRRIAVIVKRMTSPYVQNLVVLATRGGDGEGSGGGGSNQLIYQSFITWEGGVGVLNIDLPIFSPEQALKPIPLLRKATQGNPYQATFRDI